MVRIRTVNNRRRSRSARRRRASASFFNAKLEGVMVTALSKRASVSSAADARLVAEGWAMPHDPDGVMEGAYNYSDITLAGYLVGVNQELILIGPYRFDPNAIDIRGGLSDTLRQFKARITAVTR